MNILEVLHEDVSYSNGWVFGYLPEWGCPCLLTPGPGPASSILLGRAKVVAAATCAVLGKIFRVLSLLVLIKQL